VSNIKNVPLSSHKRNKNIALLSQNLNQNLSSKYFRKKWKEYKSYAFQVDDKMQGPLHYILI